MLNLANAISAATPAALAPYNFLDLMRDQGLIPGEAPRAPKRAVAIARVTDGLRAWVGKVGSDSEFDVIDLVVEAARANPQRRAPSLNDILAERIDSIRLPAQPRSSRRRERSRVRAQEWRLAA